jgi:hypothetical protein
MLQADLLKINPLRSVAGTSPLISYSYHALDTFAAFPFSVRFSFLNGSQQAYAINTLSVSLPPFKLLKHFADLHKASYER